MVLLLQVTSVLGVAHCEVAVLRVALSLTVLCCLKLLLNSIFFTVTTSISQTLTQNKIQDIHAIVYSNVVLLELIILTKTFPSQSGHCPLDYS